MKEYELDIRWGDDAYHNGQKLGRKLLVNKYDSDEAAISQLRDMLDPSKYDDDEPGFVFFRLYRVEDEDRVLIDEEYNF